MKKSRKVVIAVVLAALLIGGTVVFAINRLGNSLDKVPDGSGQINYDPPTDEEKNAGDKQKEDLANKEDSSKQEPGSTTGTKQVSVVITDASQYGTMIEVRSFVPNYYQDGTCTITFSKNGKTLVKQAPAYKDVSTTICTNPDIKRSEFSSAGIWQVSVSYQSKNKDAQGTSKPQSIKIE